MGATSAARRVTDSRGSIGRARSRIHPAIAAKGFRMTHPRRGFMKSPGAGTAGLVLPKGFPYRVVCVVGQATSDGKPMPGDHDGVAAFNGPQATTIPVRDHGLNATQAEAAPRSQTSGRRA